MNFNSYFTIKRKKYQVFIRAIFIFFRKIILIFHYPPQGAATSQSPPYSRLPLGGKLSTKLTDEGAVTLTLLKNFKQTDSRPPRLPLRGGSAAQRRWRGPPRLPPSGFSCRAAVSRQLRQLSCPQSGLKRSIVPYSRLPLGGLFSPNYRLKVVLAAWYRRTATNEGRSILCAAHF